MPASQISIRQEETLINFMELNPRLASKSGEFDPNFTAAKREQLWEELAALLNAEGPPVRTAQAWRIWWTKFVYRCRREAGRFGGQMR